MGKHDGKPGFRDSCRRPSGQQAKEGQAVLLMDRIRDHDGRSARKQCRCCSRGRDVAQLFISQNVLVVKMKFTEIRKCLS